MPKAQAKFLSQILEKLGLLGAKDANHMWTLRFNSSKKEKRQFATYADLLTTFQHIIFVV